MRIRCWFFLFLLWLGGCVSPSPDADETRDLLPDPTFARWFHIRGLGRPWDDGGIQGVFRSSAEDGLPVWTLAQWASRHNLADPAKTAQFQSGAHRFVITNASTRVAVDRRRGELELAMLAAACADSPSRLDAPRRYLLAAAPLTDTRYAREESNVRRVARFDVALACRLDQFVERHAHADPKQQGARFLLVLHVQNLSQGHPAFGEMFWVCLPIFDHRQPLGDEQFELRGAGSDTAAAFVFTLPTRAILEDHEGFARDDRLRTGDDARWVRFRADVKPWIVYAYQLARRRGLLATTGLEDLYVSGLHLGWEMSGAHDAAMRVRSFSVRSTLGPALPLSP